MVVEGDYAYIVGDADGQNPDIFKTFVNNGTIDSTDQFVFIYDFETSIPGDLLYTALSVILRMDKINENDFIQVISQNSESVKELLIKQYNIDIEPIKIKLAVTIANIMNKSHDWWSNDNFMNSELGKFIKFIQFME